jgi:hypothetical protein
MPLISGVEKNLNLGNKAIVVGNLISLGLFEVRGPKNELLVITAKHVIDEIENDFLLTHLNNH